MTPTGPFHAVKAMSPCTVSPSNQQTISPRPSSLPVPKTCESSSRIPGMTISDDLPAEEPCRFGRTRCRTFRSLKTLFLLGQAKVLARQSPSRPAYNSRSCMLHVDSRICLSWPVWQQQLVRVVGTFKVVDTRPWQTCLG